MKVVAKVFAAVALVISLTAPLPVQAQLMLGNATAIDGDTIEMGGQHIRLFGIDAVEAKQPCTRDGVTWHCGEEATTLLSELLTGRTVECVQKDIDKYGRIVAVCKAGRINLSEAMAGAGFAIALRNFSLDYVVAEDAAKARSLGVWAGSFERPSDFRNGNPSLIAAPPKRSTERREGRVTYPSANDVYFRSCNEAFAAGYAPMHRGQPGYRPGLDGDSDGIACEPYRGRR